MTKFILLKYPQSILDTATLTEALPRLDEAGTTEGGLEASALIAKTLGEKFDGHFVVTSGPARRCVEPARVICEALGQELMVDARLDERRLHSMDDAITVAEFRRRQELGFIDPSRRGVGELESPLEHRLRVETWLADALSIAKSDDIYVVVSHGAVVEHLHSALSWKPAGAMQAAFSFCAPGSAHLWADVMLPDRRRIWCCLGSNLDFTDPRRLEKPLRGAADLNELSVELALDARFSDSAQTEDHLSMYPNDKYYIR